ncbi:MAG: hypothetical protein K9M10_02495 [Candidatus Pacebacteria bacterium]|nr:hypothetical protein [Candidatus Paceibacterota bacterium]MCF7857325.1 hypothetical protein [Candidatus Paceibacterota bacterium]
MKKIPYKKLFFSCTTLLLVCSFVFSPVSQTFSLNKVEAWEVVIDPAHIVETVVGQTILKLTSQATDAIVLKEFTFDMIAWALINIMLKEMIRSTTQWVNSGFKGSPAFITDLEGFLTDIADKIAGDFIYGSNLAGLCSPFKLNVQFAVDLQYRKSRTYTTQCRLSDVVKNVDAFVNGDFAAGGWDGWRSMTLTPQNNPYGAVLEAQTALALSIRNAQGREVKLLDFGQGFLSFKDEKGNITTPGNIIQNTLNDAIGSPGRRLEVADEMNELVGALFSQLAGTVLSGAGGLLGLTNSQNGSGNYFDRMSAEAIPRSAATAPEDVFATPIIDETKYLALQNQIISTLNNARGYKVRMYGEEAKCHSGALSSSLSSIQSGAQNEAATTTIRIAKLTTLRDDYNLLRNSATSASITSGLLTKYHGTNIPEAELNLINIFNSYRTAGQIHSAADTVRLERITIPDIGTQIQTFTNSVDVACRKVDF